MKQLLRAVDAALFDLDGTLVETNIDFPLMKERMIALAVEYGMSRDAVIGLDILAVVDYTAAFLSSRGSDGLAAEMRGKAMAELEEIELVHADDATEIPFARELLTRLEDRGIRTGIVTRNSRTASLISLGIAGINTDVMICREDVERHKPHPDPVHLALSLLSARPEVSVMVGDHTMDVQSGKAAGMKTIGFLRDTRPQDFFAAAGPDFVARSLEEVLGAIVDCDS